MSKKKKRKTCKQCTQCCRHVATEIDARAGLVSAEESRRLVEEVFGPVTPLRRSGRAEEVAEAIEYLAYAEWTTGAVLDVDGGLGLGELRF